MRSPEIRVPLGASLKAGTLSFVLWGIAGSIVQSQDSPAPPAPHTRPALPDTHVPPHAVTQKPSIALHIDAPISVHEKKCSDSEHIFNIKYNIVNNTTEPANGIVRAMFNGVPLIPVGSVKLQLLPGKKASGAFTACCPANGTFAAQVDYQRDETATVRDKGTGYTYYASDTIQISCR